METGCQVSCAGTPLPLPAGVLVRGTSWGSLFVNCQPLLIYVLRWHIVSIPPAPSLPPCPHLLQNVKIPYFKAFWMFRLLIFSYGLPHRLLLAPRPLCRIGLFPRSVLPELHLRLLLLLILCYHGPWPLSAPSTRLPTSHILMLTAPDLSAWISRGRCSWLGCAAPQLSFTLPFVAREVASSLYMAAAAS